MDHDCSILTSTTGYWPSSPSQERLPCELSWAPMWAEQMGPFFTHHAVSALRQPSRQEHAVITSSILPILPWASSSLFQMAIKINLTTLHFVLLCYTCYVHSHFSLSCQACVQWTKVIFIICTFYLRVPFTGVPYGVSYGTRPIRPILWYTFGVTRR